MGTLTFPKGFKWGVAASAYQVEGAWNQDGKGESIWDRFVHTPGKILHGEIGDVSIDHYHKYKEDIALMASLGIPAYRFSTACTPSSGRERAGSTRRAWISTRGWLMKCSRTGSSRMCASSTMTSPRRCRKRAAGRSAPPLKPSPNTPPSSPEHYPTGVGTFFTHNEPWVTAMAGYFSGDHAPGIKDPVAAMRALHHLLLSHGLAAEAIRAHARNPVRVGIVLNLNPIYPASENKKDRDAAGRMDAMMNRAGPRSDSQRYYPYPGNRIWEDYRIFIHQTG